MQVDLQARVSDVLENVLEQFAFMFCELTAPDAMPQPDGVLLHATMEFTGPFSGEVALAAPQALAVVIAANALGVDEDAEVADGASDALRELLNIICGQILTVMAGDQPVFDLSIPNVEPCGHDTWQALAADAKTVHFLVEDYPFLLRVEAAEWQQSEQGTLS